MTINAHGLVDYHLPSDADLPGSALNEDGNFFFCFSFFFYLFNDLNESIFTN